MMNGRLVILSDMHLGRRWAAAPSAAALRPLWQGADHLIINGDVAEVHHLAHRGAANHQLGELLRFCEEDGVAVRLLTGNHDAYLSDSRHLLLGDGEVFVTHGDVFHPAIAPWSRLADQMRATYWRVLGEAESSGEPDERLVQELRAAEHAGYEEWADRQHQPPSDSLLEMLGRPWQAAMVIAYWRAFPGLAARFAERHAPMARYLVVGHSHRQGIWTVGERVIINTGSYGFPGRPRAVLVEDGVLSVWAVRWRRGAYRLGERPIARYELGAAVPEATEPVSVNVAELAADRRLSA